MLIKKNLQDKKLSRYKCDMCNKDISGDQFIKIYSQYKSYGGLHKEFDLCARCYKKLKISIKKYSEKHKDML